MVRPKSDIEPRILKAARARFLSEGVDGASLRRIAKEAGTNVGMVYYYFETKDDLFLAVVEEIYEKLLADLSKALDKQLPVERRLLALYERFGQLNSDELSIVQLVVREALVSSQRFERLAQRFISGHVTMILGTIFDGISDGTLDRNRHPVVLMMSIFALAGPPQIIGKLIGHRLGIPGLPSGNELSAEMLDVLMTGVGGRASSP